ncbi:hypothetical protein BN85409900 [Alteracholeplasma palmae J233]|uniref:ATPase AAA-type core domain-containing protein n=1 Tax=Alteracholeplasma palmae (strain ATCC 49389 / J233) TaxID=1318466 RepID=U4KL99_ALTPJ|nr:AAA family ATPase [Alteracholeplasma palmae]CCV64567.1 hypothetical protein BN85409900 [Alteracholeplasma palmae J233]
MIETIKISNIKYFQEPITLKLGSYKTLEIIGNNNTGKTTILKSLEEIVCFIRGDITSKDLNYINHKEIFTYELSFILNEKKFQYEFRVLASKVVYERLSGQYDSYFKDIYIKNGSNLKLGKQVIGDIKKYLELINLEETKLLLPLLQYTKDNDLFSIILNKITNCKFVYTYKAKANEILDLLDSSCEVLLLDDLYNRLDEQTITYLLDKIVKTNKQVIYTTVNQNIKLEKLEDNTYLLQELSI